MSCPLGLITGIQVLVQAVSTAKVPDERMVYKIVGKVKLHLDVFKPKDHRVDDKHPCIVFFFGGGWTGGTPSQFHPHSQYLASRGMVAISAEYRVSSRHGTLPFECVTDGKSAIRWIRQHAKTLGVDPDRIAAGGGSAGAQVAAAAATVMAFDEPSEDLRVSAKPSALVLFNPVFDNGPGGFGHEHVKNRWQEFSPLHNIAKGICPTIVFLGSKDSLIPVSTAEEYKKRMIEVGGCCYLWIYEDQPHGFFNYRDGNNPYYNATVFESDRFLASLGYLEGTPTVQNKRVKAISPKQ
ncbi:TPA: alpha/beta hydrolase [Candidatus Poribacteria bacterium]|nr:alpha/beta hydrolase [Candidatus Poribacteria bacterium]HIA66739.1 alpha/beta hydrolase [Candidatus Poribacteria bacterium]HIB90296.1 alpha/beta hydrolase [Candidatus Poribacteria bacterium]HIB99133.1 alpha/beta hydrolase [Candidatus Poribacteria bacterium]HIN27302.1 alpha/beta hydrolase [Candidatus Poribacteria bacterium]